MSCRDSYHHGPNCNCCPAAPPAPNLLRSAADYRMPVGTTGIVFVAMLPCVIPSNGIPVFDPTHVQKTVWSAAARLSDMGFISGEPFRFLREAIPLTEAECETFLGVTAGTVVAWESSTTEIPRDMWFAVAHKVRQLAQEGGGFFTALSNPPDLRPRVIRITSPVMCRPT